MGGNKDKLRHEFMFLHEFCRPFPDDQILAILRSNSWDVNKSVNEVLQLIAAQLNCFDVVSHQLMFQVNLDAITSFFFDFTVYLLPQKTLPIGISLEKNVNTYATDDDESKAIGGNDDRGVVIIKHVLPKSLALIAGFKSFDQILRLNGELISLSNSAMGIDDIYDRISMIKSAEEVVVLSCRRVLQPMRYCALPFAIQQYYLVPTLPIPDISVAVALKNRENNMDSDSFCRFLHPSVHFLVNQLLITDRRRAVLLHRLTIGVKEASIRQFERIYLNSLEVLLQKTEERRRKEGSSLSDEAAALNLSLGAPDNTDISSHSQYKLSCSATSDPNQLRKFSTLPQDKSKSIKSINRHIENREIVSLTTANNEIVRVLSAYLRPALTARIIRAEKFIPAGASPIASVSDVMYIISVYDVKTASAWSVKRSYQQFADLRQLLLQVRDSLGALNFPIKRMFKVMEHMVMTTRQQTLDAFLRDVLRIATTMNPGLISSIKLRILLERFLDVHVQYEDLHQFHIDTLLAKYDERDYLVLEASIPTPSAAPTADSAAALQQAAPTGEPGLDSEQCNSGAELSTGVPSDDIIRLCSSQLQCVIETSLAVFVQHMVCQEELQALMLCYVSTWWDMPEEVLALLDGHKPVPGLGRTAVSAELQAQREACDETMGRQLLSLRTFMDNLQCMIYNTSASDCFDIVTSYGAYHVVSAERNVPDGEEVPYSTVWEPAQPAVSTRRRLCSASSPLSRVGDSGIASSISSLVQRMVSDRYFCSSVTLNPLLAQHRGKVALKLPVLVPVPPTVETGAFLATTPATSEYPSAEVDYCTLDIYVQNAIRRQLEMELCAPHIYKHIRQYFTRQFAAKEDIFNAKIAKLKDKPQSFFGIPAELESPSGWYDVKKSFRMIRKGLLPQDRIAAFLDAIKLVTIVCHLEHSVHSGAVGGAGAIPGTSKHSQSSGECRPTTTIIGADDLLPIMIYILVNAKCVNILALNEEFKELCPYYLKLTETGYYLTTLDAALEHILLSDPTSYGEFALGRGRTTSTAYDTDEPSMPAKPGVPLELNAALTMQITDNGMDAISTSTEESKVPVSVLVAAENVPDSVSASSTEEAT